MKKKVGILATPDLSKKLVNNFYDTLPDLFSKNFGANVDWEIELIKDPIIGATKNFNDLYSNSKKYKKDNNCAYIINLTDLPMLDEKKVIAADINKNTGTILISVSAFGWGTIRKRIKRAILYAINEVISLNDEIPHSSKIYFKDNLFQKNLSSIFLHRTEVYIEKTESPHIRYVIAPSFIGNFQLITGMVLANNPLNMMKSLTSSVALSFTTGAFGMIFTTMWQLSYMFSELRLLALSCASITAMVFWIILANQLWETSSKEKNISRLYNYTTVITLIVSVLIYYITLFILFLVTCLTLIPPDFLGKTIDLSGSANFLQYMEIAWLASSIATVAGAVGVGLTNEQSIKQSTFGYRQQSRYESIKKEKNNEN
ncbi:5,10-methylene-tetrahydrofolate dehydrogenase [Staphylococcus pseudoxylosus]|uniref:5,10-methylene-tetrahydrofolate dehydrogenase n=1 Tax=Staphylococcus pseudoxylosus TaxID=2282419 RepID=UPI0019395948|nr:5,10-methylene-tetrahydrofolate dehydrogenase [Staphylococcus pseudoxylosus]MBM2659769.1 5,10-methylene-tetrahydrofolate dehydrogenase [Staphylococcus pseudoxylosus]